MIWRDVGKPGNVSRRPARGDDDLTVTALDLPNVTAVDSDTMAGSTGYGPEKLRNTRQTTGDAAADFADGTRNS